MGKTSRLTGLSPESCCPCGRQRTENFIYKSVSFPLHLCTIYKSGLFNQISIFYWIGKEWNITKSYTLVGSNTEVMKWFRCGIIFNLHGKWFWFNQLKCRFRKYIETQFRKNKSLKKNNLILNVLPDNIVGKRLILGPSLSLPSTEYHSIRNIVNGP